MPACNNPVRSRGWCSVHYRRWLAHGDPLFTKAPTHGMELAERLTYYLDRSGGMEACWPFNGARHVFGYGSLWDTDLGRPDGAHRIAWKIEHGPIPDGIEVLHHCDNAACCNPKHLFLGTQEDNLRDMTEKGRRSLKRARGEKSAWSKLTAEQVRAIRHLANQGLSHRLIASEFCVDKSTIGRVVRRQTWQHVA